MHSCMNCCRNVTRAATGIDHCSPCIELLPGESSVWSKEGAGVYEGVQTELGIPTSFCCCYSCRSAEDAVWTLSHPLPHSSFPTPPTPLFPPTSPLTLPSHFPLTSPLSTHQTCLPPLPLWIPHPHQQTQVESHWVRKFRVCLMDSISAIVLHTVFSYLAI